MNPNPFLGILYHWTGGLSAASCYLPFRGIKRWSWEVYWIVQGIFSWIVVPILFAAALVPHIVAILRSVNSSITFYAWFWGAMWGIGGLLFGLGVRYLGIALGYTIALGFSTAFGTLVPPLFAGQMHEIIRDRPGQVILLGIALCLAAIVVSGLAGHSKERELNGPKAIDAISPGGRSEFRFGRGILIAAFAGIMSACVAYGLTTARPLSEATRLNLISQGRSDLWQSLPALVIVLWGGFTTNVLWCAMLIIRNKSAAQLIGAVSPSPTRLTPGRLTLNYAFAAAAGMLWYLQFFFYSMGQTKMGKYDFSSWTLHMAGTILFATLWGVLLHEWRGTSRRTRRTGAAGFALLLTSTLVVGYGNYLKSH